MDIIKSLDNKKIKSLSKLLLKKYREKEKKFLVEGKHLVLEALKSGVLCEVLKTEDYDFTSTVPVTLVSYDVIKKLSNSVNPQKIIGVASYLPEKELKDKVLILDNLQDPGNLGTIIRSSVAFNVSSIVLSNNTVDLYNDKVLRSSEGMIFHINIIKRELNSFVDDLQKKGYKIFGTKVNGGSNLKNIDMKNDKIAIIMGNEANGVSENLLSKCDQFLYIPMNSKCESLNVGVATSIILYELFNRSDN